MQLTVGVGDAVKEGVGAASEFSLFCGVLDAVGEEIGFVPLIVFAALLQLIGIAISMAAKMIKIRVFLNLNYS